jgi:hypothetical protein
MSLCTTSHDQPTARKWRDELGILTRTRTRTVPLVTSSESPHVIVAEAFWRRQAVPVRGRTQSPCGVVNALRLSALQVGSGSG